jgi:hypothetical protein
VKISWSFVACSTSTFTSTIQKRSFRGLMVHQCSLDQRWQALGFLLHLCVLVIRLFTVRRLLFDKEGAVVYSLMGFARLCHWQIVEEDREYIVWCSVCPTSEWK